MLPKIPNNMKKFIFLSDHFFSITTNRSTGTGSSKSDVLKMFWLLSRFVFFAISWLKLNISKITVTCEICSFVDCPQVVVCLLLFGIFQCGTCCCKPLLTSLNLFRLCRPRKSYSQWSRIFQQVNALVNILIN